MSGGVCCRGHMKEKGEPCDQCAAEETAERENRIEELEEAIRYVIARNRLTPADHDRLAKLLGDK